VRVGSLFSGIGGLELGLEWAGFGPVVWQVECDEFCRQVLARHWPDADRSVTDVRAASTTTLVPVDLICGGFPCQDVSGAGNRAGLAGHRSGLWSEFHRVVVEMHPAWVVIENVASGATLWLDRIIGDLEGAGYESLPLPLSASDCGAPHLRRRLFVVGQLAANGMCERLEGNGVRGSMPATDSDQGRCGGERKSEHGDLKGAPGSESDGLGAGRRRGGAGWNWNDAPEPVVRRVDDRVASRLDRRRLAALGNAVVPQCAEVVGNVIRELIELHVQPEPQKHFNKLDAEESLI
jgi:DNA (cytosine-5)-methyltransferase 1